MAAVLPGIISNSGLTVILGSGPRMIRKTDSLYENALKAWKENDQVKLEEILNPKIALSKFSEGNISFNDDGTVTFNGSPLENYVLNKIKQMQSEELPWRPLARFLEKLMSNSSARAIKELYKFLETENLPITEDGDFLAYKRVRTDWKDFHTGKIDNSIGNVVTEPRNTVDDNPNHGCSTGLHAGALSYVDSFHSGGHLLIVKINPADVVSVPNEDVRKLRTCRYVVLSEMEESLVKSAVYSDTARPMYSGNFKAEIFDEDEDDGEDILDEHDFLYEDECCDNEDCDICDVSSADDLLGEIANLKEADIEIEDFLSALRTLTAELVGCSVAIDRPLNVMLSKSEVKDLLAILAEDFDVETLPTDTLEDIVAKAV